MVFLRRPELAIRVGHPTRRHPRPPEIFLYNSMPLLPVAHDVTISSRFKKCFHCKEAQKAHSVAIFALSRKIGGFISEFPAVPSHAGRSKLGYHFVLLAF
eukprot:GFKZ01012225.1.p2 GENE.GFKZ01012225.1~~GFKZ01012225.1.p2  ORF type:complete len:100 (+),score=1.32 GFKZ01012225.1:231-530(+)